MGTLLGLALKLERRAKLLDEQASDAAVQMTLTVLDALVFKTPVDSSEALSNWQVRLNSPADNRIDPYFPGEKGSTQRSSAQAAIEAAKAVLAGKKAGDVVYISNVLPYIGRLNDGYSGQAPAGFVEASVLIGRKRFKTAKIKV